MLGAASFRVQWKSVNANRSWPEHVDSCRFYWFRLRHAPQLKYPKLNDKSAEQTNTAQLLELWTLFLEQPRGKAKAFPVLNLTKFRLRFVCVFNVPASEQCELNIFSRKSDEDGQQGSENNNMLPTQALIEDKHTLTPTQAHHAQWPKQTMADARTHRWLN